MDFFYFPCVVLQKKSEVRGNDFRMDNVFLFPSFPCMHFNSLQLKKGSGVTSEWNCLFDVAAAGTGTRIGGTLEVHLVRNSTIAAPAS